MSEVTVTVRGEHEAHVAPERATIQVSVRTEGPDRAAVVDRVMHLAEPVRTTITARADAGVVVDWSSTRLSVRAERPWNNEGKRLAPVYYASVELTATFGEASELSTWVSDISPWDGVEIGWVSWHLTPDTHSRVEREVAAQAVGVAVARARAYAGALGLDDVVPVEIADVGLIAPPQRVGAVEGRSAALLATPASDTSMEYEPGEIVIAATVEARFLAR